MFLFWSWSTYVFDTFSSKVQFILCVILHQNKIIQSDLIFNNKKHLVYQQHEAAWMSTCITRWIFTQNPCRKVLAMANFNFTILIFVSIKATKYTYKEYFSVKTSKYSTDNWVKMYGFIWGCLQSTLIPGKKNNDEVNI